MAYYHGHYREAIRSCTPYLLDEYAIRCNVEDLITFMYSRGHVSDDQTQFINEHERTRDRMKLLLEDIESNVNIGEAFTDLLDHMAKDERRLDIPKTVGEKLKNIVRLQTDWQYIEAIRKCLPFLTLNLRIKSVIDDMIDHMAEKGHIILHEQQYIHETTRISEKINIFFRYLMEPNRSNKDNAFTDLIEKLSEDKLRGDIPKKLQETLDEIKKTSPEYEETVYTTLKRLDILYIPEERDNSHQIKGYGPPTKTILSQITAQHHGDSNLFDACMRGDYEAFERLLEDSNDPDAINSMNENGETPLIVSCKYADADFVQKLIENEGTDVNIGDRNGRTSFSHAIMRCDKQIVSLLINCKRVDINTRDTSGLTFIWCIFGEDLANDLASIVKSMYMKNEQMSEQFISVIRENRTHLNWEKIMDVVRILVTHENVDDIELLKTMILAADVPTVSYLLQNATMSLECDDISNVILNGISANNADIFKLLADCPHINFDLLNIWSVNALLKYTITSNCSREIKALMLKLSSNIRVEQAYIIAIYLLCMDEDYIPLAVETLKLIDTTQLNVTDTTDSTVFMILCQYGSEKLIREFLADPKINFLAQNKHGQTAFMLALKSRSEKVACLLLQHQASNVDVNQCDTMGMNGLLLACESGCDTIVSILLARDGMNVNITDWWRTQTALMLASERGYDKVVSLLLGVDGVDVNVTDEWRQTALILASGGGYDTIVGMLLAREDLDVNVMDWWSNQTALMAASGGGYDTLVSMLLARKDVDVNMTGGWTRHTALTLASRSGHDKVVSLLLRREDLKVNGVGDSERTGLMWASECGHDKIVSMLLRREELDINSVDSEGQTALMLASWGGHDKVVTLLFGREDLNVNGVVDSERTGLMWACECGHDKIVSMLLDRMEVDVNATSGWVKQTALMLAIRGGHGKIVSMLLERQDLDVNVGYTDGRTALMLASCDGHDDIVSLLLGRKELDVNANAGWRKETALTLATNGGHDKVVAMLLGREDLDINFADRDSQTALIVASWGGHDAIVSLLLGREELDINVADWNGQTALMWASARGHDSVVSMLLAQKEIDINVADEYAKTALMLSSEGGYDKIVTMLLDREDVEINNVDVQGRTTMVLARSGEHDKVVSLLLDREDLNV